MSKLPNIIHNCCILLLIYHPLRSIMIRKCNFDRAESQPWHENFTGSSNCRRQWQITKENYGSQKPSKLIFMLCLFGRLKEKLVFSLHRTSSHKARRLQLFNTDWHPFRASANLRAHQKMLLPRHL